MAKSNETGHAKNVALFDKSIRYVKAFGRKYDPALQRIQVGTLTDTLTNANTAMKLVKESKTAWNNATNLREIAFADYKKLSIRIMKALGATEATAQTMSDARNSYRKIRGTRAKPVAASPVAAAEGVAPQPKKTKSTSQQGYAKMVDHIEELINTVEAEPSYAPNENELQVASLRAALEELKQKNAAAADAEAALKNARITRDKVLYAPDTGIADLVASVKVMSPPSTDFAVHR